MAYVWHVGCGCPLTGGWSEAEGAIMVGMIEPMAMTNAVATLSLPLDPRLAMGILIGALVLAGISISLAVAPPSWLRRIVRLRRSAVRLRPAFATV